MLKVYMALFIVGLLGSIGYGGYWYYTDTQARLIQLRENNTLLEQANQRQQAALDTIKADQERAAELNRELTNLLNEAEGAQDKLRRVLDRLDLAKDAREDPNGLEERINNAVERLIKTLEEETTVSPVDTQSSDIE